MRRVALLLAVFTSAVAMPLPSAGAAGEQVDRSYIVTLASGDPGRVAADHGARHGVAVNHVYRHAIRGYAGRMSAEAAARVAHDSRVAHVEADQVVTTAAQSVPTGVQRVKADLSSTTAGDGSGAVDVDVAIIDTGIDATHPDLNVVGGVNCSTGRTYDDGNGHGSHVAGTVGAKDDAGGVVGVAPGARLWAVRVLNNAGSGTTSSVLCGIDWVTAKADVIEVANMSLGGSGSDSACGAGDSYHNAICASVAAGVTYVVAAGNDAADANNFRPATYAEVITVSALADFDGLAGGLGAATCRSDEDDTFASFSNYGADVDIIAPGVCITSAWKDGGYSTISGTSMASPHVAGAAALYRAANPGASPAQVQSALQSLGSSNWSNLDDRDLTKEPLLDVSTM